MVGAQYAYWGDYNPTRLLRLLAKWNLAMPLLTLLVGYFPGKRLGWLEDLRPRIALERATRHSRLEASYPATERADLLERFHRVTAPIMALHVADDEFTNLAGIERALAYYTGSDHRLITRQPAEDEGRIGNFGFFHESESWLTGTGGWMHWPNRETLRTPVTKPRRRTV